MKGRTASGHIEMVISFGMFVMFVVFLIYYLQPIRNQDIGDVLSDTVQRGVENLASVQLIELPLLVNNVSANCFRVPHPFSTYSKENMLIRNSTFGRMRFEFDVNADQLLLEDAGKRYYLYYANVSFGLLPYSPNNCSSLDDSQYEFGAPRTYTTFFYPNLQALKQAYQTGYLSLKQNMSFPQNAEFTVNITDTLGTRTITAMTRSKPQQVEVKAKELPIEILYEDGTIEKAVFNVQVW